MNFSLTLKKQTKYISVCVATYNGSKYIREQLLSILKQISKNDEVIVSDDISKDDTVNIIKSINDNRIRFFRNNGRHGVVPNFENALRHAKGYIIFLSDQDDIWMDNKVEICERYLNSYDLVVHNLQLIDSNGNRQKNDFDYFKFRNSDSGYWHNLIKNGYMGSCMAFKRSVLERALPFPKHILWHDMWIGLIASKYGKTIFINNRLILYRRHGDNASPTSEKSSYSIWMRFRYRIQMFWYSLWR